MSHPAASVLPRVQSSRVASRALNGGGHHSGPGPVGYFLVPALLEAKHAGAALYEQFETCKSFSEVVLRLINLDEVSLVGVIMMVLVLIGLAREHTGRLANLKFGARSSKKEKHQHHSDVL